MSDRSDSEDEESKMPQPNPAADTEINFSAKKRPLPTPEVSQAPKKAKAPEKPQIDFSTKETKATKFQAETVNIKDFCNVLLGIGNLPNLEYMFLMFNEDGMMVYGKPTVSSGVAMSFWNKQMFDVYCCPSPVKAWVTRARMEAMRKQISKNVASIKITQLVGPALCGLCFSGSRECDSGGKSLFEVNVFQQNSTEPVLDMSRFKYDWHVVTSSKKLFDNVKWLDNEGDFSHLVIENDDLVLEGLNDAAIVSDRISHKTELASKVKFKCVLLKRYLKVVTATHDLHKSVTISFMPESTKNFPVLFMYPLDQAQPQSHFSVYLSPCNTANNE
jgi:hypothetical protein